MKVDNVTQNSFKTGGKINFSQSSKKEMQKRMDLKKNLSANEIRSKVQEHFKGLSITGDPKKQDPEKIKEILSENDPKNPATIKKLKNALEDGTINFSLREREILEKIIK
jgi:transposase